MFNKKHKYSYQHEKKKVFKIEMIHRYHIEFKIINECHTVKNVEKEYYKILKKMKNDHSQLHF